MKPVKKINDSDSIWDIFPHEKVKFWLECRIFGDPTSDRDWVIYCAKWEGYLEAEPISPLSLNNGWASSD